MNFSRLWLVIDGSGHEVSVMEATSKASVTMKLMRDKLWHSDWQVSPCPAEIFKLVMARLLSGHQRKTMYWMHLDLPEPEGAFSDGELASD